MKFKKMLSFMTAAAISASCMVGLAVTAGASGVDDLVEITEDATFVAQTETNVALTKDTLSWGDKLLTLNGDNAYNTTKGYSVYNDMQVQNLLQLKQGRNMAVKVSGPCTIDVYHDNNGTRTVQAGSTNRGTDYSVTKTVYNNEEKGTKYDIDTISVPKAGVVYIGADGDVYVAVVDVKISEAPDPNVPTQAPTPEPNEVEGVDGTVDNLVAATETTTYDLLKDALLIGPTSATVVYRGEKLFYNNTICIPVAKNYGLMYYSDKGSVDLNGTENKDGIRLKAGQDDIAVKLAAGATVETKVKGGGSGERVATISSTVPDPDIKQGDLATSESLANYAVNDISYTNNTGAEQVVYLSATGDSFISQIKVTVPATEPTEETVKAKGETFSDLKGAAAASFKTDAVTIDGTIKTAQWKITASNGDAPQEATVNVDGLNIPEFSGESSAIFGIIIKNIKTGVTIDSAEFVYTVE